MELSLHTASTSASVHGTCFCLSSLPHTLLVSLSNSPVPPLVGRSWLEVNLTRPQVPCLIPTGTPFPSNTWALDSHCYSIFMCGQTGPDRYVENQTLGAGWGGHTLVHTSLSRARLAPSDPSLWSHILDSPPSSESTFNPCLLQGSSIPYIWAQPNYKYNLYICWKGWML